MEMLNLESKPMEKVMEYISLSLIEFFEIQAILNISEYTLGWAIKPALSF